MTQRRRSASRRPARPRLAPATLSEPPGAVGGTDEYMDFESADEAIRWLTENDDSNEEENDVAQLIEFTNRDKGQGPILVNPAQILTVDAVNASEPKQGTEIRLPDNVRAYVQESVDDVRARVAGPAKTE